MAEFTGTASFREVSEVACEIGGIVDRVHFEEGGRVKKGEKLVKLNSEILEKNLEALKASHRQIISDLEQAKSDLRRMENLYKEEAIAEQLFEEQIFKVSRFENGAEERSAEVERVKTELKKTIVYAPFEGVIIKRSVDKGEWCDKGDEVAIIAMDDEIDVVLNIPQEIIRNISKGMRIRLHASGRDFSGEVTALIPRGDVSTRTFPVKIRTKNDYQLIEGMEVSADLPIGKKVDVLAVPRDAVIMKFGKSVIFVVKDSKAVMVPVKVLGYEGLTAGIRGEGLSKAMDVVIKGNERIGDGQALEVIKVQ